MQSILLVPLPPSPIDTLDLLEPELKTIFQIPVERYTGPLPEISQTFDASRNQYYSTEIIALLLRQFPTHQGKILSVTAGDLFVPVLTYVFGEAQLEGTVALVSSCRLDDQLYGLPPNKTLAQQRLLKECVHELGHAFGLVHCQGMDCVMRSSTVVEEIDTKSERFCPSCRSLLATR
jgi:archaemetzincin